MTNAEKYKDAIMAQMCKTGDWAVNEVNEIISCEDCSKCIFRRVYCSDEKEKWLNTEADKKKAFSEKDKEVIRALDKVKWVARDKEGNLWAYFKRPFKDIAGYWCTTSSLYTKLITDFSTAEFASVKWEDDWPTSREEILGDEK